MSRQNGLLVRTTGLGFMLLLLCLWPLAQVARAQTPIAQTAPLTDTAPLTETVPLTAPLPPAAVEQFTQSLPLIQAAPTTGVVLYNANLRGGPGTNFAIVGKAPVGTTVNIVDSNPDRTWYRLDSGAWIATFLVQLGGSPAAPQVVSVVEGQPAGIVTTVVTTVVTTTVASVTSAVITSTMLSSPDAAIAMTAPSVPADAVTAPLPGAAAPPAAAAVTAPLSATVVVSTLLPSGAQTATLVAVLSGDQIEVEISGVRERVRYLGVDAPDAGETGFATATAANNSLLQGKPLLLLAEQTDRDSVNQLLRHVYVEDKSVANSFNGGYAGIDVAAQLVAAGWALPQPISPDISKAPDLARWAADAARGGRGFWMAANAPGDAASFALTRAGVVLFSGPGADTAADSFATPDTPLLVLGRSQDGGWVQVRTPRRDAGWVYVPEISLGGPVSALPVTGGGSGSGPTPAPLFGQVTPLPGQVIQPTPTLFPGQVIQPTPTLFPGQVIQPTPTLFPGQVIQPTPTLFPGQVIQPTPFPGQVPGVGVFGPTVVITSNLRSGPGTFYPLVGSALPGAQIVVSGRSDDTLWLQTGNNSWIAAGLVTGVTPGSLPAVAVAAAPAATATPQPTPLLIVPPGATAPTPTITPIPSPTPTPLGNPTPTATPIPPTPLVRLIALDRGNEWVILYNDGTGTQDLAGWVLVSEAGDQRCPLSGKLAPRESMRVWAQVGPDGLSCGFAEPIWENAGPDAAILLDAYGDEVSRIQ